MICQIKIAGSLKPAFKKVKLFPGLFRGYAVAITAWFTSIESCRWSTHRGHLAGTLDVGSSPTVTLENGMEGISAPWGLRRSQDSIYRSASCRVVALMTTFCRAKVEEVAIPNERIPSSFHRLLALR